MDQLDLTEIASALPEKTSVKLVQPELSPEVEKYEIQEWTGLIPQDELDILMNPPTYISEVEDGSLDDQITSQLRTQKTSRDDPYQQALVSRKVIPEMNGKSFRIPGFIVPLDFTEGKTIKEFFLVPFFGACIHVPPPPPNQIIYVKYPKGLEYSNIYEPIWVAGTLKTGITKNDVATAAYSMEMEHFEIYVEPYPE